MSPRSVKLRPRSRSNQHIRHTHCRQEGNEPTSCKSTSSTLHPWDVALCEIDVLNSGEKGLQTEDGSIENRGCYIGLSQVLRSSTVMRSERFCGCAVTQICLLICYIVDWFEYIDMYLNVFRFVGSFDSWYGSELFDLRKWLNFDLWLNGLFIYLYEEFSES